MKQVLLAEVSRKLPPYLLWVGDDVMLGDRFMWKGKTFVVDAVYGTQFTAAVEARRTEFPHQHRQSGIAIDHHGNESTGAPSAPPQAS